MALIPDMCPKCGKYHHDDIAHRATEPSGSIDLVVNAYDEKKHEPMDTIEDLPKVKE